MANYEGPMTEEMLAKLLAQQSDGPMNDQILADLLNQSTQQPTPRPAQPGAAENFFVNNTTGRRVDFPSTQQQPRPSVMPDYAQPIEIAGAGKGYRVKGDPYKVLLSDGRVVDPFVDRAATNEARKQQLDMERRELENQFTRAKMIAAGQLKRPEAPEGQRFTPEGNLEWIPGSAGAEKIAQKKREGQADKTEILSITDEAEKILPLAHGSGVGAAAGMATNFLGIDDPKSAADAQLRVLSGALVSKMPRMQGPQSDKDVQMYKEMAGQVGDPSLPASVRSQALKTVKLLYGKYSGQGDVSAASISPSSTDHQQTLFNAKKAIARNPGARDAILQKMQSAGYDTRGL